MSLLAAGLDWREARFAKVNVFESPESEFFRFIQKVDVLHRQGACQKQSAGAEVVPA
jgi:hypothetical protein